MGWANLGYPRRGHKRGADQLTTLCYRRSVETRPTQRAFADDKKNICGQVTRELVPGTVQLFYMKGYGAVELGAHRLHHPGHEYSEAVREGKFIDLWRFKEGAWKITQVIGYGHRAAAK